MTPTGSRTFLVECYVPDVDPAAVEADARRASAIAADLRRSGVELEYVNAMLVPGDDAVFHVFAAHDEETVREASLRAELPFERIVESIAIFEQPTAAPMPGRPR